MAMVSEAKVNGSEMEQSTELPPALAEKPAGLPPGKYALVGWDMDTTGRRLIDEVSFHQHEVVCYPTLGCTNMGSG